MSADRVSSGRRLLVVVAGVCMVAGACSSTRPHASAPRGGVLRLAMAPIGSLDPALASTPDQQILAGAVFSTLTAYDPGTGAPVPALATRWSASADQRRWVFNLRSDARFSNGRPITAADVKYTFDRIARQGSGSPVADLLDPVAGSTAVGSGAVRALSGITATSLSTVQINLDTPLSSLPSVLANPNFGVVAREAVESPAVSFADRPVGSGPFLVESRSPNGMVLARRPGANALVDRIEVSTFADPKAAYDAFARHAVDWTTVDPADAVQAARRFGSSGYRPLAAELFYGFNLSDPVFAEPGFREAIIRAVDRDAIAAHAYGGTVRPFAGLVVNGIAGAQADPCGDPCTHDVAVARALVLRLFPAGPPPVAVDFDADPSQEAVAESIRADLQAIGVKATLRPRPLADYRAFVVSGHAQLFRLGWVAAYPSADAFLVPLFGTDATANLTGFSDAGVDRLLAQARADPDPARQIADYQAAERSIMARLPLVPVAQYETHALISARVHHLQMTVMGTFDPATVSVRGS